MTEQLADRIEGMAGLGLPEDDIFTLQAAVEHLRSAATDEGDMDGRARRAGAAFRIAYKLEQIIARQRS